MSVLGLDLALRRSGYAVLEGTWGRARVVERGVIATRGAHPGALHYLHEAVAALVVRLAPETVFVEVPGRANANRERKLETVIALAKALGVAEQVCAAAGVACVELDQADVKGCLTGGSRAGKPDVQAALRVEALSGRLLGYEETLRRGGAPDPDIADAVAVALVGLLRGGRQHATA